MVIGQLIRSRLLILNTFIIQPNSHYSEKLIVVSVSWHGADDLRNKANNCVRNKEKDGVWTPYSMKMELQALYRHDCFSASFGFLIKYLSYTLLLVITVMNIKVNYHVFTRYTILLVRFPIGVKSSISKVGGGLGGNGEEWRKWLLVRAEFARKRFAILRHLFFSKPYFGNFWEQLPTNLDPRMYLIVIFA